MAQVANTGPYGTEAHALEAIVSRIVDRIDPEFIWLFGSRAEGRHRPDSDFDLLVVLRREDTEHPDLYDYVYSPVLGTGVGCDVLPCTIDDYIRELQDSTSMVARIHKRGVKLHERSGDSVVSAIESGTTKPSSDRICHHAEIDSEINSKPNPNF